MLVSDFQKMIENKFKIKTKVIKLKLIDEDGYRGEALAVFNANTGISKGYIETGYGFMEPTYTNRKQEVVKAHPIVVIWSSYYTKGVDGYVITNPKIVYKLMNGINWQNYDPYNIHDHN